MKKKLVAVKNEFGYEYGLYNVPELVSPKQFETEFNKSEDQSDFDENNTIGAERVFCEEFYIL